MTDLFPVMTPKFFSDFSCIGTECKDHCCHSWNVSVNKKSYKKLKSAKNKEIRSLVIEHFKVTKTADSNWAFIQMGSQGDCPIIDDKGLCKIHGTLGHKYLPVTCQEYPRQNSLFGDQLEPSLFMSCPSAAQNILFDPSAMLFTTSEASIDYLNSQRLTGLNRSALPYWMPTVREVCFQIILDAEATFEERLFSLGLFLKQAESKLSSPEVLDTFINNFIALYNEKKTHQMYASLPSVEKLKWQVFASQDKLLVKHTNLFHEKKSTKGLSNSAVRFQRCRDQLLALMQNKGKPSDIKINEHGLGQFEDKIESSFSLFNQIWEQGKRQHLDDYFAENPHIWTNFALYYIYHHQFLILKGKSLFEFFKVMAVDIFMIKSYLAAIALNQQEINDEWVLQLFQSYSRRRQHGVEFIDKMEAQLKADGTDSAGAILGLLK